MLCLVSIKRVNIEKVKRNYCSVPFISFNLVGNSKVIGVCYDNYFPERVYFKHPCCGATKIVDRASTRSGPRFIPDNTLQNVQFTTIRDSTQLCRVDSQRPGYRNAFIREPASVWSKQETCGAFLLVWTCVSNVLDFHAKGTHVPSSHLQSHSVRGSSSRRSDSSSSRCSMGPSRVSETARRDKGDGPAGMRRSRSGITGLLQDRAHVGKVKPMQWPKKQVLGMLQQV